MKLKVKHRFSDKYTGDFYVEDMILEVSAKRGKELLEHPLNLVEEVKEEVKEEKQEVKEEVEIKPISKKSKKSTN